MKHSMRLMLMLGVVLAVAAVVYAPSTFAQSSSSSYTLDTPVSEIISSTDNSCVSEPINLSTDHFLDLPSKFYNATISVILMTGMKSVPNPSMHFHAKEAKTYGKEKISTVICGQTSRAARSSASGG